ncbi:MAG: hypothetical protein NXI31_07145 [bacterium]|nr:hypothetical protein [bacterium]
MTDAIPPFLQQLLDRGIDPLGDARAREWLLAHPEALPSFAALREALAAVAHAPVAGKPVAGKPVAGKPAPVAVDPVTNASRTSGPLLAAAGLIAAALLVASGLVFWSTNTATTKRDATDVAPLPRPNLPTAGRVIDHRVASSRLAGSTSERHVVTRLGLAGVQTHHATRAYESGPHDRPDAPTDHAITIRGVTKTIAHVLE